MCCLSCKIYSLYAIAVRVLNCGSVGHSAVVSALQHLTQLTHIDICNIDLSDGGSLLVTHQMTQLQKVELKEVKMTARRWPEFFSSLQRAPKLTNIKLSRINLGDNGPLLVTPHMAELQKVGLMRVKMTARRWPEFFSSLQRAPN